MRLKKMDASKFYGRKTPRFRFLSSALDSIECINEEVELVVLPPESGDQNIDNDEEGDDCFT